MKVERLLVLGLIDHHHPVAQGLQKIEEGLNVAVGSVKLTATKCLGSHQQELQVMIMAGLIVLHHHHIKKG